MVLTLFICKSCFQVLLDNGARIDPKNEDEATPLHIAAQFGQHITMKEILDHDKNTINAVDENANTALHLASIEGKVTGYIIYNNNCEEFYILRILANKLACHTSYGAFRYHQINDSSLKLL